MCLIINRNPNIILPKEDFLVAAENNPDGWGLSVPDCDGRLYTMRSTTTEAEELYDLLHKEFKADRVLLHLRFTTAGDTILRNSHPFPVLEAGKDGVDLRVAHNGTLHKYSHPIASPMKWESDTRNFVRSYIRPLFKRLVKGQKIEEILNDPFTKVLLEGQLTSASVLSFIDGEGRSLEVNPLGNKGEYRDGYWVSNVYSFNKNHRVPSKVYSPKVYGYQGYDQGYGQGYDTDWRWAGVDKANRTLKIAPPSPPSDTAKKFEAGKKDTEVTKFTAKYEMAEEELLCLTDKTLDELIEGSQEDTLLLIKELLAITSRLCNANKALSAKLQAPSKNGTTV